MSMTQLVVPSTIASPRLFDVSTADSLQLCIADDRHTPAINSLRQRAYMAAGYFTLPDPRTVMRDTDPAHAICLVVTHRQELAATVRIAYAAGRSQAEAILEGAAPVDDRHFPTVALCRGATAPGFRGQGLMAFLVSLGVAVAHEAGLGSALGVQYDGTPHYRAMNAAGWNRKPIVDDRMNTVKGQTGLALVHIARERFDASVRHSEQVHATLHRQLPVRQVVAQAVSQIRQHH